MAELLVSYQVEGLDVHPHGQRVWEDGRVESYRVTQSVQNTDGSFRDEAITPGWYPLAHFSETQTQAVQREVQTVSPENLPTELTDAGADRLGSLQATWQFATSGGLKTIRVAHWPPASTRGLALLNLAERISTFVLDAQASQ